MSTTLPGTKPYLTLYIKVARSCKRLFCRLGRLARLRRLEYSTECVLYTILTARYCTLSTFLASEALQKCHIRWQYVKYGNIEDLYKSNFAFVLAFIHSSLMCLLNTRCSSTLTPRRLRSTVLSMTCALIVDWSLIIPGEGFSGFRLKASLHGIGITAHSIKLMVVGIHV